MGTSWTVDAQNRVSARNYPISGRMVIEHNGREVFSKINFRLGRVVPFTLDDGRNAQVEFKLLGTFQPGFRLEVEGVPLSPRAAGEPVCPSCQSDVKRDDEFCGSCGAKIDATTLFIQAENAKHIQEATTAIRILVALFILGGIFVFFMGQGEADGALQTLADYPSDMVWPEPVNGVTMTVEELRSTIDFEKWSPLVLNFVLALVFAGIAVWSKKAPLPAILTAGSIYIVIHVLNAVNDPATIAQGLIMKIIVLTYLASGLKAALASRRAGA